MADYTFTMNADFSEVFAEFGRAKTESAATGTEIGKNLSKGVTEAKANFGTLMAELRAIKNQQTKLPVDSSEYKDAQDRITQIKALLAEINNKKTKLSFETPGLADAQDGIGGIADEVKGFNALEAIVSGFSFSLADTLTNAAASAVASLQGLVSEFAALDTQIRQAAASSGETDAYDTLKTAIDQVGIEAAGSAMDVAELATELVRGGMTADQASTSLGGIVRGAEATGTSFSDMGQIVSATLQQFGLDVSDTSDVVDVLVQGANSSATSVTGLGEAMKLAGPVAKVLGVSVNDTAAAVGLFTNAGISASEAGTTLRNGLSQLATAAPVTGDAMTPLTGQAKKAADTMKELGINIYNTDGTLKPMEETLLILKGAFDKLDPASKINIASNLFGGNDDGAKWLAVLGMTTDKITELTTKMQDTKGATDTARDAMQGFEMKTKQLDGTLSAIGNVFGEVVATALTPFIDLLNNIAGVISGLPDPVKQTGAALIVAAGAFTAAAAAIAIFNAAMKVQVIQAAATSSLALVTSIGTALPAAIASAAAALPAFIAALNGINSLTVGATLSAIVSTLKTGFVNAVGAAATGFTNFLLALQSGTITSALASVGRIAAAFGPVALAIGLSTAAFLTWQNILSGSKQVQQDFSDAQKATQSAIDNLNIAINDQASAAINAKNAYQVFVDYANESLTLQELSTQFTNLQAGFTAVQMSALQFYAALKDNASLSDAEVARAKEFVKALDDQVKLQTDLIAKFKEKAAAAEQDGNPTLAQAYRERAAALQVEVETNKNLLDAYNTKLGLRSKLTSDANEDESLANKLADAVKNQASAQSELNTLIENAPVRNYANQIEVGNQLLALTTSLTALEQSRSDIIKGSIQFELDKAQERGANEEEIGNIKARLASADQDALGKRYAALLLEQTLQSALLTLAQKKAMAEANIEGLNARKDLVNALAIAEKARRDGNPADIAAAQIQVDLAQAKVNKANDMITLLNQTQPIEKAISDISAETARNSEQAKAAAMGFKLNVDGSLTPLKNATTEMNNLATASTNSKTEIEKYKNFAADAGLNIGIAKDGTVVLGSSWSDVNTKVNDVNDSIEQVTTSADNSKTKVGDIKTALDGTGTSADGLVTAFTKAGEQAPTAVTAAQGFAGALGTASSASNAIKGIRLDTYMGDISGSTQSAAAAAQEFYNWLNKAAGIPAARWTGGPVEGGETYQVNELGQESFLSAGRLSLINAPSGGTWRAPSTGTVIPAGITAQLQARGAIAITGARLVAGGAMAQQAVVNAEQAVALGKLEQAVDRLTRKDWNVHVTMRQGPTGSQVIKHLNRLL